MVYGQSPQARSIEEPTTLLPLSPPSDVYVFLYKRFNCCKTHGNKTEVPIDSIHIRKTLKSPYPVKIIFVGLALDANSTSKSVTKQQQIVKWTAPINVAITINRCHVGALLKRPLHQRKMLSGCVLVTLVGAIHFTIGFPFFRIAGSTIKTPKNQKCKNVEQIKIIIM
jgi:hypothetical protein